MTSSQSKNWKALSLLLAFLLAFSPTLDLQAKRRPAANAERFRVWSNEQSYVQIRTGEFRLRSAIGLGDYRFRMQPFGTDLRSNPRIAPSGISDQDWTTFNNIRFTILNFVIKVLELPFLPIGTVTMIGSSIRHLATGGGGLAQPLPEDRRLRGVKQHRKNAIRAILKAVDASLYLSKNRIARTRSFVIPLSVGFDGFSVGFQIGYSQPIGEAAPRLFMETALITPTPGVPYTNIQQPTNSVGRHLDDVSAVLGVQAVRVPTLMQGLEVSTNSNQGSVNFSLSDAVLPILLGSQGFTMPIQFNSGSTSMVARVYVGQIRNTVVSLFNRMIPPVDVEDVLHQLIVMAPPEAPNQCRANFR